MSERNLQFVVNRIKNLPTLPHIIPHLMRVLDNPNSSAADVGKVISSDQSLMTKILKLVNSAMYGLPRRISTLSQATAILGFNAVRSTAIAATVFQNLGNGSFNRMKFWEHALGCAVAGKIIARRIGHQNAEEAFIAGLVHDIGKMIIDQYLNEDFLQICARVESGAVRIYDAEVEVLGISHAQIGEWLARKWNLPLPLVNAISFHHQPNASGQDSRLVAIIHLGDALTRLAQIGSGGDNLPPIIHPSVWPQLELEEAQLPELIEEINVDYANSSDFLHVLRE
jgi:putative nucleotidyltransferase with HDIG domain